MALLFGGLLIGALGAAFAYLRRGRADVMEYHHIETPHVNAATHGGGGGGGGGGV